MILNPLLGGYLVLKHVDASMSNTNNKDNPNLAINPNPADLEPRKSINAPEVDQSIFGLQVYDLPEGLQVSSTAFLDTSIKDPRCRLKMDQRPLQT